MMIRVLHNFGGKMTNEKRIKPGEYDDDDDALFGIGDYLVANGHAERMSWGGRVRHAVAQALTGDPAAQEPLDDANDFDATPPADNDAAERPVKGKGKK